MHRKKAHSYFSVGEAPIHDVCLGSGNDLWFTQPDSNTIGFISRNGRLTKFKKYIPAGARPACITEGVDGSFWFTEPGIDCIGQIKQDGTVHHFHKGISCFAGLSGIAAARNGEIWFTERLANKIGKISIEGDITEFMDGLVPCAGLNDGICVDAAGNIWFTQDLVNQIGCITPAGKIIQNFKGISPEGAPSDITTTSDGSVWFTGFGTHAIGRISQENELLAFDSKFLGSAGNFDCIQGSASGDLWLASMADQKIYQIPWDHTTAVAHDLGLKKFFIPGPMAVGLNDDVWFVDIYSNKIIRVTAV